MRNMHLRYLSYLHPAIVEYYLHCYREDPNIWYYIGLSNAPVSYMDKDNGDMSGWVCNPPPSTKANNEFVWVIFHILIKCRGLLGIQRPVGNTTSHSVEALPENVYQTKQELWNFQGIVSNNSKDTCAVRHSFNARERVAAYLTCLLLYILSNTIESLSLPCKGILMTLK